MEHALVTWWTSGIGETIAHHLSEKWIFTILTGSRDEHPIVKENEIYLQHDQLHSQKISEEIYTITEKLKYIFLNAGIFVPDDSSAIELFQMKVINCNNISVLDDLYANDFIMPDTRIIVNASIQAEYPREYSSQYAFSKKTLTHGALSLWKKRNLNINIIGPSLVRDTPMAKQWIEYYADKKYGWDVQAVMNEIKMIGIESIIDIIDKSFFSEEKEYEQKYKHKFIPIKSV